MKTYENTLNIILFFKNVALQYYGKFVGAVSKNNGL